MPNRADRPDIAKVIERITDQTGDNLLDAIYYFDQIAQALKVDDAGAIVKYMRRLSMIID